MSRSLSLFALLDMTPPSPGADDSDSDSSRGCSPMAFDPLNLRKPKTTVQNSPLFKLPDDIFKCVLDYLDRDEAWSLKRLCKGMSKSESVNQLLYKYPIQLSDVRDLRLGEWKYRTSGQVRWQSFQESVNDENRSYVQKLALSHWVSIDDFRWIEANLPALTTLDISAIKDFVWTPEETWTWKMLAEACPVLFSKLEELEVANWADYTAHSRIEYSYSYNDYRFKQKFRLSRRRGGGSVAKEIFPLCEKLKTLAIRERYSGFHTWNEWEVHQRVCCLVDGVQSNCPSSLTKLKVHDYAPYRSLFSTDATDWPQITDVEIGLYSWMEDRRERDVIGPIPYRITQGHHHRDEEEAFDDKSFDNCKRDHMTLGNHVVQGVGASFEDLLQSLQTISKKYPKINIKPIRNLENITLHPFHLVNVMQRRQHFGQHNAQNNATPPVDPCSNAEVQEAIRWLLKKCDWKPILAWDSMMCDVFPANLEPNRTFLPKPEVLTRIQTMVTTLRSLNIPIRLSIGDRTNTSPSSGLDGSLYFGDYKAFAGTGDDKEERLLPTQACFNLTPIAHMVDELTIQYPVDVPGVSGYLRAHRRQSPAEKVLMDREMTGWRRFWTRYATQFTNLKKLTANVPNDIYEDWAKTELPSLLNDGRWEMLEVPDNAGDFGFFGSYFPFSSIRYSFSRKRGRVKFVQRVFFRRDEAPLNLVSAHPSLTEAEREERHISDEDIADKHHERHRFWTPKEIETKTKPEEKVNGKKRKAGADDETTTESKRLKIDEQTA
ncbi:hypothetical protein BU25DRAFT_385611 [Macroventuria anomochaeta]|uniref:Uncharacterized protein n=1 Tax=Macroventuria anomochaeta TaxID=301207 RepID=A0ACB6SC75_9PLEO|nr:uncharacterized protein BU25DRAFT_385611 [Macroventuria anomochaeta]KAF2630938.1 hypothetical protein BU25DRAFT_385611 [Macroventuria anomochaeta]